MYSGGFDERIVGAWPVQRLVVGARDVHAQRGAAEIDALPAALGEPDLDERVGLVLDEPRRDAERVRRDHERERAMAAHADLAVAQVAVRVAGAGLELAGLERAEVADELVERDAEIHVRVDAELAERDRALRGERVGQRLHELARQRAVATSRTR